MDTEDESDNTIPGEITTMASQGITTLNQDTLSLTSTPQVSKRELAEVTNLVRELQSEIIQLRKKKGNQATEGEVGLGGALVLRSVDVRASNKAVKAAIDE